MAVQIVISHRLHFIFFDKVGHAVAHAFRDVGNHISIPFLQPIEHGRHFRVPFHEVDVGSIPARHRERFIAAVFVECAQQRDFGFDGDSHVVLHRVQGAQNQVEDAHRVAQRFGELLDDDGEALRGGWWVVVGGGDVM